MMEGGISGRLQNQILARNGSVKSHKIRSIAVNSLYPGIVKLGRPHASACGRKPAVVAVRLVLSDNAARAFSAVGGGVEARLRDV